MVQVGFTLVCVENEDYPASLDLRKIYQMIPDARVAEHRLVRVIDESGEDYLYPAGYFIPIELPQAAEETFFRRCAEHRDALNL